MNTTINSLNQTYPLDCEQIAGFQSDGHILLRGVVSPDELAQYRPAINAAADKYNHEKRALEERDTYGKAFLQIQNLWEKDPKVRQFVLARRFARIAADLLGVENVRLYHDQALFKEPGGGPTPWHQDQYYWPLDTDQTITMWMPLVDIPAEVGSMTFATGSHREGYLGELEISDASEAAYNRMIAEREMKLTNYGALKAGDATWHLGWTLHGAPGNPTDNLREVMTVIYFADGARVLEPEHKHRENDLKQWMPGAKPGDVAATALNPVLL